MNNKQISKALNEAIRACLTPNFSGDYDIDGGLLYNRIKGIISLLEQDDTEHKCSCQYCGSMLVPHTCIDGEVKGVSSE